MFGTRLARMSSIIAALWLVLGTFVLAPPAAIAENSVAVPPYREGRGSPDGIGKFYQGREIAAVMGFEGAGGSSGRAAQVKNGPTCWWKNCTCSLA